MFTLPKITKNECLHPIVAGWHVRGSCLNSKKASVELCDREAVNWGKVDVVMSSLGFHPPYLLLRAG